jgi:hypothetical protein
MAVVLQLGQKSVDLHSGSSPQTTKANLIIEHDGRYQIAYALHHCEGTELSVANVTVGGLSWPRPETFQLVTATSADEASTRTLPLYYGNWQVIESGKTADCSWIISVKPVAF